MTSISSTHFFKFIKPGSKYNLSIPKSIWKKWKETRCRNAMLKRGRHEWAVDISDEGVFCDGWKEFVRDNGVEEFDFIVFKHQGNYVFDFMVFDQSMCERQYPSYLVDEMDIEEPLKESDLVHTSERSKVRKKRKRKDYSLKNEDGIQVDDDRCFTAKMTPSCIKTYRLHIPAKFVRSNGLLTGTRCTQVVLMDETQRTWQATFDSSQFHIGGLREFIKKSDLKVEDECKFELIKHGKLPVFNVVIRKTKCIENNMLVKKKRKTISTIKKETRMIINNNQRSFISTLKPNSLTKSGLYVPTQFSIQNGLQLGEVVLKDDNGRSWNAQLNKKGEKAFYVGCKGLRDFCYANGLKEGDTFKFELVKNEKDKPLVAKISCYVNAANSTPSEKEDHPYFIVEVKDYFIKKSMLHLPSKFAKTSGLVDKKEMILKTVKDEKSWTVKLKSDKKNRYAYLSGQGWKDFCAANDLKEGDLFKLELVSNGEKPIANFYLLKIC